MRHINQEGLDLIKEFEGFFSDSYLCPSGVWTIGYGHTGKDVKSGQKIDNKRGEELLRNDVAWAEEGIERLVEVPVTDNMFSALVSLAFNIGVGGVKKSNVMKYLNGWAFIDSANAFLKHSETLQGKVLPGLLRRRKAERELFLKDIDK